MELHDTPLPQDLTEGCDDDEWVRSYRVVMSHFFILLALPG